jgi:hypothetical protein
LEIHRFASFGGDCRAPSAKWIPVLRPIALSTINARMIFFAKPLHPSGGSCANGRRVLWAGQVIYQATIEPAGF